MSGPLSDIVGFGVGLWQDKGRALTALVSAFVLWFLLGGQVQRTEKVFLVVRVLAQSDTTTVADGLTVRIPDAYAVEEFEPESFDRELKGTSEDRSRVDGGLSGVYMAPYDPRGKQPRRAVTIGSPPAPRTTIPSPTARQGVTVAVAAGKGVTLAVLVGAGVWVSVAVSVAVAVAASVTVAVTVSVTVSVAVSVAGSVAGSASGLLSGSVTGSVAGSASGLLSGSVTGSVAKSASGS